MNADGAFSSIDSFGDPDSFAAFLTNELPDIESQTPEIPETLEKIEEFIKVTAPEMNGTVFATKSLATNCEAIIRDVESSEIHDDEYFKSLGSKQISWLEENCPNVQTMEKETVNCTSCNKQMHVKSDIIVRHPLLGVPICKGCNNFYENGIGWELDEDGSDIYCRWCGHGGKVMVCDGCLKGFCTKCLKRNLGRNKMAQIIAMRKWDCVDCKPEDIYQQKRIYYGIYKYKLIKSNKRAKVEAHPPKKSDNISGIEDRKPTFIDDSIAESFEVIKKYQKQLEEHHSNWIKGNRSYDNESVTTFTQSLRKLHSNLKRNINSIDKALVNSYIAVFPENATKIYNSGELKYQTKSRNDVEANTNHKEQTANTLQKSKTGVKSIKRKHIESSLIESKKKNINHKPVNNQKKRMPCSKTKLPYRIKVSKTLFQKKKKSEFILY